MALTKEALSTLIEKWGTIEDVATGIVLIGVVGEFVAELTKLLKSGIWKRRIAAYSTLAVIIGIAGELASQHRLSDFNGQLVAGIEIEANTAIERAARLEAAAAPREITQPKTSALVTLVKAKPRLVRVETYIFDVESARLAAEIILELSKIGINVQDFRFAISPPSTLGFRTPSPLGLGLFISGSDPDLVKSLSEWTQENSLKQTLDVVPSGIPYRVATSSYGLPPPTPDATISVGVKP